LFVLAPGVLLLLAGIVTAGGEKVEPVERAHRLISEQQKVIAFFMHPTATLKSVARDTCKEFDSGDFCLDYTFRFTSVFGNEFESKIRFYCFGNGALDYCAGGQTTGFVRPFTASNVVVDWLKGQIRDDPALRDNRQVQRLLDTGNARTLLEWWLKGKA
jgi:hypothetical protein